MIFFKKFICNHVFFFLQDGRTSGPGVLTVMVQDVVEGNFTLNYAKINEFKIENISNSEANVTVPEVR